MPFKENWRTSEYKSASFKTKSRCTEKHDCIYCLPLNCVHRQVDAGDQITWYSLIVWPNALLTVFLNTICSIGCPAPYINLVGVRGPRTLHRPLSEHTTAAVYQWLTGLPVGRATKWSNLQRNKDYNVTVGWTRSKFCFLSPKKERRIFFTDLVFQVYPA